MHCILVHGPQRPASALLARCLQDGHHGGLPTAATNLQLLAAGDVRLESMLQFAAPTEEDLVVGLTEAEEAALRMYAQAQASFSQTHPEAGGHGSRNGSQESGNAPLGMDAQYPVVEDGLDQLEADALAAVAEAHRESLLASMRPPGSTSASSSGGRVSSRTMPAGQAAEMARLHARLPLLAARIREEMHSAVQQHDQENEGDYSSGPSHDVDDAPTFLQHASAPLSGEASSRIHPRLEQFVSTRLPDYGPVVVDFVRHHNG